MLRLTTRILGSSLVCLALGGVVGCGPRAEPKPPTSDAVTTEPLDIELPKGGAADAPAAPASEPDKPAAAKPAS